MPHSAHESVCSVPGGGADFGGRVRLSISDFIAAAGLTLFGTYAADQPAKPVMLRV